MYQNNNTLCQLLLPLSLYHPLLLLTIPSSNSGNLKQSFSSYAAKLGYPDNLINRVVEDMDTESTTDQLLERLISLHDMLYPKVCSARRRRDATSLPSYMLVQDSFYKGKERMPYWVWVKRETISVNVTEQPPFRRPGARSRSSSSATTEIISTTNTSTPPTTTVQANC